VSPFWLSFACNELRIFGEFATLTKKIELMPRVENDLIRDVLTRINFELKDELIYEVKSKKFRLKSKLLLYL
jgi:hypothetical protein